jgi:membrane protease YdiL (CAAX protease family)
MRFNLPEPNLIVEARQQSRRRSTLPRVVELLIECAIFVVVFMVSETVLMGITATIALIPVAFTDPAFLQTLAEASQGMGGTDLGGILTQSTMLSREMMETPQANIAMLFATVGIIVGAIIYCRAIVGRKLATMGLRHGKVLREYLVGLLVGSVAFSAVVIICWATGTLTFEGLAFGSTGLIVLFFLGFLVQGASEEIVCRGYFMVSLARRQNLAVAIFVSSAAFGALHLFNDNVQILAIVNITLFGCFEAVYLLKRGNIWGAAAIHSSWNFVQGNIFGTQVSGTAKVDSIFSFGATQSGELINGGAFGPEGGLAATLVLVVALAIALLMKSVDAAPPVMAKTPGTNEAALP